MPLKALESIMSPKIMIMVGRIAKRSITEKNLNGNLNLLSETYHLAIYSIVKIAVKTISQFQKKSSY